MISKSKLNQYLASQCEDTDSELDRFLKDLMILIEFGNFDYEDEESQDFDPYNP